MSERLDDFDNGNDEFFSFFEDVVDYEKPPRWQVEWIETDPGVESLIFPPNGNRDPLGSVWSGARSHYPLRPYPLMYVPLPRV